uniref:Uncharacterized protein n=1 Tax=Physcomitrium patens TaxID=3218 RepID=A0A2K1JC28_PHYPA|nr:hypothetical protein PHYPA_019357 [Physcomitrium patens]
MKRVLENDTTSCKNPLSSSYFECQTCSFTSSVTMWTIGSIHEINTNLQFHGSITLHKTVIRMTASQFLRSSAQFSLGDSSGMTTCSEGYGKNGSQIPKPRTRG